jgi:hypothetical protein
MSTGDGWTSIIDSAVMRKSPVYECVESPTYDDYVNNGYVTVGCGGSYGTLVYFYSFYLLVNLIFLNLFVAIILEGLEQTRLKDAHCLNEELIFNFRKSWAKFDPNGTSFIKIS